MLTLLTNPISYDLRIKVLISCLLTVDKCPFSKVS